ncbi:hypothetical protein BE221DRAFT_80941, partial [Ostreococcus tauri]
PHLPRVVVSRARNRAPLVPRCRRRDRSNTDPLRRAIASIVRQCSARVTSTVSIARDRDDARSMRGQRSGRRPRIVAMTRSRPSSPARTVGGGRPRGIVGGTRARARTRARVLGRRARTRSPAHG